MYTISLGEDERKEREGWWCVCLCVLGGDGVCVGRVWREDP